jgi:CheY-like chemotaxis protein
MKNILIVDDDAGIQDVFRLIFEGAGYSVSMFQEGESIMDGRFELPDLFILDKQLSGVDGLDVCRHLKLQPNTARIPIIMVSATPHVGPLAEKAGADFFLEKPFRIRHLLEMVSRLMLPADAIPAKNI